MRTKSPTVWVSAWAGVAALENGLRRDSPAWFAWLDDPATTSFAYPVFDAAHGWIDSFLTVRKERRQRGGTYWTAYRHVGGRLRKVYLGRSSTVNHARLLAVAAALLEAP